MSDPKPDSTADITIVMGSGQDAADESRPNPASTSSIGFETGDATPATLLYRSEDNRPTLAALRAGGVEGEDDNASEVPVPGTGDRSAPSSPKAGYGANETGGVIVDGGAISSGLTPRAVEEGGKKPSDEGEAKKFGMVEGVLVRCLLNIWGVIMFLRLGWMVGHAGIAFSSLIILMSAGVTGITTLSLSAVATNGEVKGGGAYYLISRSLGPEFGGSIGVIFSIANAVAVALYVIGFAETLVDTINDIAGDVVTVFSDSGDWDLRIYGICLTFILLGIVLIGTSFESRIQGILLVILSSAITSFFVGSFAKDPESVEGTGFVGFGSGQFSVNWGPNYQGGESFFSVFSIFFPAATGIMAGANISGDLKNPSASIPKGTLLAVLISTIMYVVMVFFVGAVAERGIYDEDGEDTFGLYNNLLIMRDIAIWSPLVYAGIFAATLSSALASLVGAPRIFQAVCKDKIFSGKFWEYFAVGRGPSNDPRRAYFLAFGLALLAVFSGDLNAIAPLITNFFLISYALINYACFAASISSSPGWRPAFKYWNKYTALIGAVACVALMFLISVVTSLITWAIAAVLYKYIEIKSPDINWGSAGQASAYQNSLKFALKLENVKEHVKNYRPQLLVLAPELEGHKELLKVMTDITDGAGLLTVGRILQGTFEKRKDELVAARQVNLLRENKMAGFSDVIIASSLREGTRGLMQVSGLGKMRTNAVVMGFKRKWVEASDEDLDAYVGVVKDALDLKLGMIVARNMGELDLVYRPTGTIDVYWLADDGGLTLLIPHLMARRAFWSQCKLRMMAIVKAGEMQSHQAKMLGMLNRFRIKAEVVVLPRPKSSPTQEEIDAYTASGCTYTGDNDPATRYIRLGSLIQENSVAASLVVVSLPVPRDSDDSRGYISRLATLTRSGHPTLIMRGNQENVLTFFS